MGRGQFPRTPEHRARISDALRGRRKSVAHRAALSKPKSEATKIKLSVTALSRATQERRRQTMIARYGVEHPKKIPAKNNLSVDYWLARGCSPAVATKKISQFQAQASAKRTRVISHWSQGYWIGRGLSAEEAKARVSALQTENAAKSIRTVSSESTSFFDQLEVLGGRPIEREQTLLGRFKVDGLIPSLKIVIEYFGSFWHMHPALFKADDVNRVTGWRASSKWAEDRGRVKYLERAGYLVWVVWDHEAAEILRAMGRSIRTATVLSIPEEIGAQPPTAI